MEQQDQQLQEEEQQQQQQNQIEEEEKNQDQNIEQNQENQQEGEQQVNNDGQIQEDDDLEQQLQQAQQQLQQQQIQHLQFQMMLQQQQNNLPQNQNIFLQPNLQIQQQQPLIIQYQTLQQQNIQRMEQLYNQRQQLQTDIAGLNQPLHFDVANQQQYQVVQQNITQYMQQYQDYMQQYQQQHQQMLQQFQQENQVLQNQINEFQQNQQQYHQIQKQQQQIFQQQHQQQLQAHQQHHQAQLQLIQQQQQGNITDPQSLLEHFQQHLTKEAQYKYYLNLKLGLQQLTHKKIGFNTFMKYVSKNELSIKLYNRNPLPMLQCIAQQEEKPHPYLNSLVLHHFASDLDDVPQNNNTLDQYRELGNVIKQYSYVRNFTLLFPYKQMGNNPDYTKIIKKSMRHQVKYLEKLSITVNNNQLGNSLEGFNNICETISKFENVQELFLNYSSNYLFRLNTSLFSVFESIKPLQKLKKLTLSLAYNNYGDLSYGCYERLYALINQMQNLEILSLDFKENNFGLDNTSVAKLFSGISQLKKLKNFQIDFSINPKLGLQTENIQAIAESIGQLQQLERLNLSFKACQITNNLENLSILLDLLRNLGKLKCLFVDLSFNDIGTHQRNLDNLIQGIRYVNHPDEVILYLNNSGVDRNQKQIIRDQLAHIQDKLYVYI